MRLQSAGVALLGICGAHAFRDTSPFMYFSTSSDDLMSQQITSTSSLHSAIDSQLLRADSRKGGNECPMHTYIVAVQPGVSASDFGAKGAAPTLQSWVTDRDTTFKSKQSIAQVVPSKNQQDLDKLLSKRCSRKIHRVDLENALKLDLPFSKNQPRLIVIDLPKLPAGATRSAVLRENDLRLADAIKNLPKKDYTVFYVTSPPSPTDQAPAQEPTPYEMFDSQSALHVELKRDWTAQKRADDDIKLPDGPLFERYQFFTPGLFMGLLTVLFLFAIGYMGISALSGLQVSYAAFDKENGPQGQRSKAQ